MHKQGFFYVVNYGLEKSQVERIFDIAAVPFEGVSPEEKKAYEADIKGTGEFIGYKPMHYWVSFCAGHDMDTTENVLRFVAYREWGAGSNGAL